MCTAAGPLDVKAEKAAYKLPIGRIAAHEARLFSPDFDNTDGDCVKGIPQGVILLAGNHIQIINIDAADRFKIGRGHGILKSQKQAASVSFLDCLIGQGLAVAEALMDSMGKTDDEIKTALAESMKKWGRIYPDAGYGCMFYQWLHTSEPKPYGSYGNGSAMRVSSAGWLFDTLEETRHVARLTAEVTHNHPEGIKGAEATASAIWMARNGRSKDEIRNYIIQEFGYNLSRTCDEIRPAYYHIETCQKTVPEAITAFMEGNGFEDVVRTAVSLGGDCDTLTCIAAGMAEAMYEIPEFMKKECLARLPEDMKAVLDRFNGVLKAWKEHT